MQENNRHIAFHNYKIKCTQNQTKWYFNSLVSTGDTGR